MDHDTEELSRERAASSEPCSTRPNPFNDNESSSRKRQRVSRTDSPSRSVDTPRASIATPDSMDLLEETVPSDAESAPPQTPPPTASDPPPPSEPTSSRVTINLRTTRPPESIPSSPSSTASSFAEDSTVINNGVDLSARISVESGSDVLSAAPPIETPSSSPSGSGSVDIEVITLEDDDPPDSTVAIVTDLEAIEASMKTFPYQGRYEGNMPALRRVMTILHTDAIDNEECFCKLRDWIESYLLVHGRSIESWYNAYIIEPEFWKDFHRIVPSLSHRSRYFGQFLRSSSRASRSLSDLLCQFARLTAKFINMDVYALEKHAQQGGNDNAPELVSPSYLAGYGHLLRKEDTPHIGKNLENHYNWNWDDELHLLSASFQSEGGSIEALTNLIEGELKLVSQNPRVIDHLTEPCRLIQYYLGRFYQVLHDENNAGRIPLQDVEITRQQVAQGYRYFGIMSNGLSSIIEEKVTFLAPESAMIITHSLAYIFRECMRFEDPAATVKLEKEHNDHPRIPRQHLPMVVATHWRFTILESLIKSTQMQLRVNGVTTMCSELLRLWGENKNQDPSQAPVLLYFANFIIDNRIIEYLVSIGSHPEIIHESYNILGFLIVTKTYTDSQAVTLWQTVQSSQDPRVVDAILKMLRNCFNLQDYNSLLLLCEQVNKLELVSFTLLTMRDFVAALFRELIHKANSESIHCLNAAPYELCVRLIRESSKVTPEFPSGQTDIQHYAGGRLRDILPHGPASDIRHQIYSECIVDVDARTDTAAGSICVINALLRQNINSDMRILTAEHGLTKLIIQELESTATGDVTSLINETPANIARRELIRNIILYEPGTISPTLGSKLWNLLVGEGSKSVLDRNTSWQILNNTMKKSSFNNVFLDICFKKHLPLLPPDCFTSGTMDFIGQAMYAWLEKVTPTFVSEARTFEDISLDQLWRLILEAPPNTIDALAIDSLVVVYVESELISSLPRSKAKVIHLALVDRCLKQLAGAALKLKSFDQRNISEKDTDKMLLDGSDDDFHTQEMIFARSLAVLREFLKAYQSKPQFAVPKAKTLPPVTTTTQQDEKVSIKYQSFDGDTHSSMSDVTVGKLEPVATLFAQLEQETGFKNYKVFWHGHEIDPEEVGVCKSVEDLNLGGLILIQRRDAKNGSNISASKTTIEFEIMKHFDELWGYLGMHEKVAKEIYVFLADFPVYERLQRDLVSDDVAYSTIFPQWQPFKSLYAIYALREYTIAQAQAGTMNESTLTRAISLISSAISDPSVINCCPDQTLKYTLALHLVDLFVDLLRDPVLSGTVTQFLNENLLNRLTHMLYQAKNDCTSNSAFNLTGKCFEAILEASLHNLEFWNLVRVHMKESSLLRELLLDDRRALIRKTVAKQIMAKCTMSHSLVKVSADEFTVVFWPMVSSLIPQTMNMPYQCDELFSLCIALFKRLGDTSYLENISLEDLLRDWADLLLSCTSDERVDIPEGVDLVIQGLANLCLCSITAAKLLQQPLACSKIGVELFQKHLFPELSLDVGNDEDYPIQAVIPLLNTASRHTIGEIIFFLVKDDPEQYRKILQLLQNLVPYSDSMGHGSYIYELSYLFERSRSVRSPTGYVGLRNLSNTCYLNSLLTQLFMNVPFRDFMLNSRIADGGLSQRLLSETQSLFSYMQNTLKRFVDPSNLASAIRTWDDANIDVNIQMDVDEFYNLLFDRWESQLLSEEAKRNFRSFYSGQLLQQVKSKECPHISERQETFAAISCDVKGKTCLNESLQAYVDGEVMEGDNKYKCSTCDRHVDAVKRTCLKDLPDNLLFHLKRFDYNLRTGLRSKLNDHFTFPDEIDMRPYKVEHLMDTPDESPPDVFELVGILVHSGTAESGHYFSYIKERPSTTDQPRWSEFNDDLVTQWDPASKEAKCFGGFENTNGSFQLEKQYSAYMLFYQRASVLRSQEQALLQSKVQGPVRLPLNTRLHNHIAMENELLMRRHCLYDPAHANFVNKMLTNIRSINRGRCSNDHDFEKEALITALNHLDQIVSRVKDIPDFIPCMLAIRQICHTCAECSRDFLEWFHDRPDALRNLLLRNPETLIRTEMAASVMAALMKVKLEIPYAYGLLPNEDEIGEGEDEPRVIHKAVESINVLWDQFHNTCRAWPEYFGLIGSIAKLGDHESAIIMDFGFLHKLLEVVSADLHLSPSIQYTRMLNIVSKRISTRPVSYDAVISLLHILLGASDLDLPTLLNGEERLALVMNGRPMPLTFPEKDMILQHWVRNEAHIITEKLLQFNQNPSATTQILIMFLEHIPGIDHNIYQAIIQGIRKGTTPTPCAPFLRAALTYCEYSFDANAISRIVTYVAKVASRLENMEGKEFLQFFKDVLQMSANKINLTKDQIRTICMDLIPTWGSGLLNYWDAAVREATENMLTEILFMDGHFEELDAVDEDEALYTVKLSRELGLACLNHLQDAYLSPNQQAVRATLESILRVIESCSKFIQDEDHAFLVRKHAVLSALERRTVEVAEEENSDWENSDGEYPSSPDPMENIQPEDLDMDHLPT